MTLTVKILLALLVITVLGSLGFVVYKSNQMSKQQDAINKSMVDMKQLQDGISRSQAQYATKQDLDTFAKQNNVNLDSIKKDLATLNANVTGINNITFTSTGTNTSNVASTSTSSNPDYKSPTVNCNGNQIPCPNGDPFAYQANLQSLTLNEQFAGTQVPIGDVSFSAWKKAPWDVKVYPRTYSVTNVLGTDQDGRHYIYNKVAINSNNKDYSIQLSNAKFEEEYPSPSFSWLNPRLFIGVDGGVGISRLPITGEITPNVSIGLMSYGISKVNPDWSFVQVGVGYGLVSRNAQVEISPAQYNIGKNIPLMKNTYIGPALGIGFDGAVMVGAGLRVGL